jgi:phage recombination protein Bet
MSNESKAVQVMQPQAVTRPAELSFSPEQVQVIKDTIAKGVSDVELGFFLEVCKATGLDPLRREIHAVQRYSSKEKREIMTIQVGIDGLRGQAESTGKYAGQRGPFWCGEDEVWKEVWLKPEPPAAAKIEILRHGFTEPLTHVVTYSSYCQTYKNQQTGRREPMGLWNTNPSGLLGKCAEAGGLRRAFPRNLRGLYIPEELGQMDNDAPPEIQQQRMATQVLTAPESKVPEDVVQRIRDAAHKVNVEQAVANKRIEELSAKWDSLDEDGRKKAQDDILNPWREASKKRLAASKAKSSARRMAGAPKPEPEPPAETPAQAAQAEASTPKRNTPAPEHVRAANPWIDEAEGVNPDDFGAASKAVATQGDGESESADEFVDGIDDVADTQAFLGREPGDEPPEEFEEEPF